MWTKRQAIDAANKAVQSYQQQAKEFHKEAQDIENDIQLFHQEFENQLHLLTDAILGDDINDTHITTLSQDWGCQALASTLAGLQSQRSEKIRQRDELSDHETIVNRFDLLESSEASLVANARETSFKRVSLQQELAPFEQQDFQWLLEKNKSRLKPVSLFDSVRKFITMENRKRKKFEKAVKERFQKSFRLLLPVYQEKTKALSRASTTDTEAQNVLRQAKAIVSDFDELNQWDSNFSSILQRELSKTLSESLRAIDLNSLIRRVPPSLRQHAAGMHANLKKVEYAKQLANHLKREEQDRLQRVQSISRVEKKWRRNPKGSVRGDKSKWLQDVPAMKRQGTKKRLGWSQQMRGNLSSFHHYHHYGHHYYHCCDANASFLAYDLFNRYSDSRMPYEGFSSSVIDEITPFREECGDSSWTAKEPIEPELPEEEIIDDLEEPLPLEGEEDALNDETESAEADAATALAETLDSPGIEESADDDSS